MLKLYTYETPLYKTINEATCRKDRRAVPTLGPFAELLYCCVSTPPEANSKKQTELYQQALSKEKIKDSDKITLYRGLGLPLEAIQTYKDYLKSGK